MELRSCICSEERLLPNLVVCIWKLSVYEEESILNTVAEATGNNTKVLLLPTPHPSLNYIELQHKTVFFLPNYLLKLLYQNVFLSCVWFVYDVLDI